ncbi:Uncharacterised protein [Legionella busanensis]|uniref:Uncharacterized protein n=1 Tax=Legionella busanensis TaxID=190655 RepID=A0A378JNB0_9GAMM|nr:hypothetical protein [Legionella busanensis]STX51773.1 Uncharacterised protein [Legionella busanensis]
MIEVNIWFPSTHIFGRRVKNALGSFFAGPLNENAGHVNFKMDILEGSNEFSKVQNSEGQWIYEKSFARVGEKNEGKAAEITPNGGTHKQRTIKLEHRQVKKVRVNVVHHSFWPGPKPSVSSVVKDVLHLMGLSRPSKGVASEVSRHDIDMNRENNKKGANIIERRIDTTYTDSVIEEQKRLKVLLVKALILKKQELVAEHGKQVNAIKSERENLAQQVTTEKGLKSPSFSPNLFIKTEQAKPISVKQKISYFETQTATLPKKQKENERIELERKLDAELKQLNTKFAKQIAEYDKEIKQIQSTISPHDRAILQELDINRAQGQIRIDANSLMSEYELRKALLEEAKLNQEIATFQQRLKEISFSGNNLDKSKKQQIESINFNIETTTVNLLTVQERLEAIKRNLKGSILLQSIDDIRKKYRQYYEDSDREMNYHLSSNITNGCHSDTPIMLPTKETNQRFCLDEARVLEEVTRERTKNYSFITNNCVSSAKRCLIAGLTDEVREALKKHANFNETDFEVSTSQVETLASFQAWLFRLNEGLRHLNSLPMNYNPEVALIASSTC